MMLTAELDRPSVLFGTSGIVFLMGIGSGIGKYNVMIIMARMMVVSGDVDVGVSTQHTRQRFVESMTTMTKLIIELFEVRGRADTFTGQLCLVHG